MTRCNQVTATIKVKSERMLVCLIFLWYKTLFQVPRLMFAKLVSAKCKVSPNNIFQ